MTTPAWKPTILAGDPAPTFFQRTPANPRYAFDTAAGRYLVLCFFGTAKDAHANAALSETLARTDLFDDERACFFGISNDPTDEAEARVANRIPGFRFFWDFDLTVAKLYGAVPPEAQPGAGPVGLARFWVVLDPTLRVIANIPFRPDGGDVAQVLTLVAALPAPERFAGIELQAPVLYLPRVFEPELCRHLIGLYGTHGGQESGFMREVDGRTVGVSDPGHKRRKDYDITDKDLVSSLQARFLRRVVPEIAKVHQFMVTRMERYIVSCYAAEDGGHFAAHRDNTTAGTAHRRFAVSVNLNDEFDGGEVSFPEYGPRGFKAPPGGAVVFSCSLLHKVSRVTRGRRYAFLPFLYDDAAAKIRERNAALVGEQGSAYRAG
jgi:predicted 2-oxoglutarate/Fe(II)-dependent dioxygenase YbiX/peroxiredoxin